MGVIRVVVNGAFGRMGLITQEAIKQDKELSLVGALGKDDDLGAYIDEVNADVVVDFTVPEYVFSNAKTIISAGARPVIGTSGLTEDQIKILQKQCESKKLGGVIAPNFSLGAILLMKYATDAISFFKKAEIVEIHHDDKTDSPSGTSVKLAKIMGDIKKKQSLGDYNEGFEDNASDSRGEMHYGTRIHSIRLPGTCAHHEVIFGGHGETLLIRHDILDRHVMMPGVCLACKKVMELDGLVYGLENIYFAQKA